MATLNRAWPKGWSPHGLVELSMAPRRIEIDPATAAREAAAIAERWPAILEGIPKQDIDPAPIARALAQLGTGGTYRPQDRPAGLARQVATGWKPFFDGPQAPFSWESVEVLDSGTLALSSGPVRDPRASASARSTRCGGSSSTARSA